MANTFYLCPVSTVITLYIFAVSPECKRLVGRKRIRKEVNRLTSDEKSILNSAMKKAMKPHPVNGFSI